MLYVGLDLSRKRLQWEAAWLDGVVAGAEVASPDADGLVRLAVRVGRLDRQVVAVIESMTGARFVPDSTGRCGGWAQRSSGGRHRGAKPRGVAELSRQGFS